MAKIRDILFFCLFLGMSLASWSAPVYLTGNGVAAVPGEFPDGREVSEIRLHLQGNHSSAILLSEVKKAYLSKPREERIAAFADQEYRRKLKADGWHPLPVVIQWQNPVRCGRLFLSENADMKDSAVIPVAGSSVSLLNLKAGTAYYCRLVSSTGISSLFCFQTEAMAPRLIALKGIANFRDLGGRIGLQGKRVKQGELYRCAALNRSSRIDAKGSTSPVPGESYFTEETQNYFVEHLGIRTDLDLRNDKETAGMTGSPAGEKVKWMHIASSQYQWMLKPGNRAAFAKDFRVVLNPENRPVAFHCVSGQDRTGALAFLLNGLLGVSEEDLFLDWEMTGFWNASSRFTHKNLFWNLYHAFDEFPGNTIQERIYAYALSCGITAEEIREFRRQLLE